MMFYSEADWQGWETYANRRKRVLKRWQQGRNKNTTDVALSLDRQVIDPSVSSVMTLFVGKNFHFHFTFLSFFSSFSFPLLHLLNEWLMFIRDPQVHLMFLTKSSPLVWPLIKLINTYRRCTLVEMRHATSGFVGVRGNQTEETESKILLLIQNNAKIPLKGRQFTHSEMVFFRRGLVCK